MTSRSPTTMSASPATIGATSFGMSARVVLVVGVGVDDDVGAELQAGVEPGLEARGQALVVREPDDVVDAVLARHLDGAVGRAVVDDEPLDDVEARDLAREVGERGGERRSSLKQGIWMMSFMRAEGRAMLLGVSAPTLSRPRLARRATDKTSGQRPRLTTRTFERVGAVVVCLCAAAGFFLYPTYPNYDSPLLAALGARAPPPRAAVASRPTAPRPSIRWRSRSARSCRSSATAPTACSSRSWWRASSRSSSGCTALGRTAFTPLVGVVAAVLVITRFDFPFLAARGYIDIRSTSRSSSGPRCSSCAGRGVADRPRAARARRDAAPGGVAAHRPVLALGRMARVLAAAHRLRGAGGARARGLGR